jgi:hypothetical protein
MHLSMKQGFLLTFAHLAKKFFPPFMEPGPTLHVHKTQKPLKPDLSHMDHARILQRSADVLIFSDMGSFQG